MSEAVATSLVAIAILALPFAYASLLAWLVARAFLPKRPPGALFAAAAPGGLIYLVVRLILDALNPTGLFSALEAELAFLTMAAVVVQRLRRFAAAHRYLGDVFD